MLKLASKKQRTTTVTEFEISEELLLEALKGVGLPVPDGAKVFTFVRVPGGGDWSNTDLEIKESPIQIRITSES